MRARLAAAAVAVSLAAACQTAARYQGDESSPYFAVPAGSRLVLNQPLSFQPGQVSVHVQNGQVIPITAVQKYDPFCKFELYGRPEAARTVAPGDMTVTRTRQHRQDGTFSRLQGVQLAGVSLRVLAQAGGEPDGGPPLWSFLTHMDLRSATQPDVFRLTCLRWAYPGMAEHVTIEEIRRTLAPLFTLRLPAEG